MKDFEFDRYIKNPEVGWSVCNVKWLDCEMTLGPQDGFELEWGGRLLPLSPEKLIYVSTSGKTKTFPARGDVALLPLLEVFEKSDTEKVNYEITGSKNESRLSKIYRRLKDKFFKHRRPT